ncbi:MAG TPA: hypothetical protein VFS00_12170, partial [Polyangiaceae bacterium]|nr:hypothetical protein [Polyangiaceae bacterium]
ARGWVVAAFFAPAAALLARALAAAFVTQWLRVGPEGVELSARLGPLASWPLGALPPEEGLCVRATPLAGGSPLEVELAIEGPSGRLTWRTSGLAASARLQDEVIEALGARLAPGRPGAFHGGRLHVRRSAGRLEIAWPGDAPGPARTRRRLALSAAALAVAAAGPSLAPAASPGGFAALAALALASGLVALARAPAAAAFARASLVLTPGAWRYENRGLLWRAVREGAGPLRASPGHAGPGPRRDVEGAGGGRVALRPAGRRVIEVGGALTLHERRWLVELVEHFHDVARAR